ncbi:MAG: hypothetical protein DCC74_10505 [Proteobacteria bacterium]|nr:MAG: hypothetical protein DCC74_10505 [Pseudomonadota bacterium]
MQVLDFTIDVSSVKPRIDQITQCQKLTRILLGQFASSPCHSGFARLEIPTADPLLCARSAEIECLAEGTKANGIHGIISDKMSEE